MSFICGDEFRWKVEAIDEGVLASIDFDGSVRTLSRMEAMPLIDATTRLMQWICDFSGFSFTYNPEATKFLVKPQQLRRVMMRVVLEKHIYWRPVLHASDDRGLSLIERDPIGLDNAHSSHGCMHGRANYVSTSMHSAEGSIFQCNSSSVTGQVLLMLLFSPYPTHRRTDTIVPYEYATRSLPNTYADAIAIKDNSLLLPIAIMSP